MKKSALTWRFATVPLDMLTLLEAMEPHRSLGKEAKIFDGLLGRPRSQRLSQPTQDSKACRPSNHIGPDSFFWHKKESRDDDQTWRLQTEQSVRRRVSTHAGNWPNQRAVVRLGV
jgi:hypothetical protein